MKSKKKSISDAYADRIDVQKFEEYLRRSEYSKEYELLKDNFSDSEYPNMPLILIEILTQYTEYLKENRREIYKFIEEETDKDSLVFFSFVIDACCEFSFPEEQLRKVVIDKMEEDIISSVYYEKILAKLYNLEFAKICLRLAKKAKYEVFFRDQLLSKKNEIIESINFYSQLKSEKELQGYDNYTSKNKDNKGIKAGAILVASTLSSYFQRVSSATEEMSSFIQFVDKKDKDEFLGEFRSILNDLFADEFFQKAALSELDKDFVWNKNISPTMRLHALADILEVVLPSYFLSISEWDELHPDSSELKKAFKEDRFRRIKRLIKPYKIF